MHTIKRYQKYDYNFNISAGFSLQEIVIFNRILYRFYKNRTSTAQIKEVFLQLHEKSLKNIEKY